MPMNRQWQHVTASLVRPYRPAAVLAAGVPLPAAQAAAAADGAARATGRPAVLLAGSGAELNAMLPVLVIADADSVPLVVLVRGGTAADLEAGRERAGALPDTLRLTEPFTGWNTRVDRPEDVQPVLEAAFTDLARRRPRPLLIELADEALPRWAAVPSAGTGAGDAPLPGDAAFPHLLGDGDEPGAAGRTAADTAAEAAAGIPGAATAAAGRGRRPAAEEESEDGFRPAGGPTGNGAVIPFPGRRDEHGRPGEPVVDRRWLDQVAAALVRCRQPAIVAGGGAAGAGESLRRLAEHLGAPVFLTLAGRGLLPAGHPLAVNGLAAAPARRWLEEADVVLVVGTSLSPAEHGDLDLKGRVIQVDRDAERLGRNVPVWMALPGDAAPALAALVRRVEVEMARPVGPEAYLGATGPEQRRRAVARLQDELAAETAQAGAAGGDGAWLATLEPRLTAADPDALSVAEAAILPVTGARSLLLPVRLGVAGYAIPAAWGAARATGRPARAVTTAAGLWNAGAVLPWIAPLAVDLEILVRLDRGDEGGADEEAQGAGHPGDRPGPASVAEFFRRAAPALNLHWDEPGWGAGVPAARLRPAGAR